MKLDTLVELGCDSTPQFNVESYKALLVALLISKTELDIDLLLMLKEEVPLIFLNSIKFYSHTMVFIFDF